MNPPPILLPEFEDRASIWLYGFREAMDDAALALVHDAFTQFMPTWVAHEKPVNGVFAMLERRFLLLCGTVEGGFSGCSVDSTTRVLKDLRSRHRLDALDRGLVFFRREGQIAAESRPQFAARVGRGEADATTPVFDLTATQLGVLRRHGLERPLRESWHARAFLIEKEISPVSS